MSLGAEGLGPNSEPEGLSPDGLRRVIATCDRFEEQWRVGGRPRIEDALGTAVGDERVALLRRLVPLEREFRRTLGEEPDAQEYLDRFADDASALRAVLSRAEASDSAGRDAPLPTIAPEDEPSEVEPPKSGDLSEILLLALRDTATHTLASFNELTDGHPVGPPLPMPDRIGRYQVIRLLGEGGFGRVYLAWDDTLNRNVAVKVPRAGAFVTARHVRAFITEARLAASLNHPGIVTVHDIGNLDDNTPFVVMEYVEGLSLSDLLRSTTVSHRRLAELLAQVAETLHYAHSRGLVHRDLKPANLLIDLQGRPHVADFGLAMREEGVKVVGRQIAGTLHYMAPEQVRGELHRLDGRTDLWGLGVVLYQMLTGRLPFQGRDRAEVFRAIISREPVPPTRIDPSLPRGLERICLKCLAKSKTGRYPTALELAAELWNWISQVNKETRTHALTTHGEGTSETTHDSESIAGRSLVGVVVRESLTPVQLLFEELANVWGARPDRSRYLPTLAEWLCFAWSIKPAEWTPAQARMMRAGAWHHARRLVITLVAIGVLASVWKGDFRRRADRPRDPSRIPMNKDR